VQRVIRHPPVQAFAESPVISEALALSPPVTRLPFPARDKTARVKTLRSALALDNVRFQHVAAVPDQALLIHGFTQAKQLFHRDLRAPVATEDKTQIAGTDPPLKSGMADAEEPSSQAPRDRPA